MGALTHGRYAPKIAVGLGLRMDWGPQYTARQLLDEPRWLEIRRSPSYVGEPKCKGYASHCTPFVQFDEIAGRHRRFESLRPRVLTGGLSPGGS